MLKRFFGESIYPVYLHVLAPTDENVSFGNADDQWDGRLKAIQRGVDMKITGVEKQIVGTQTQLGEKINGVQKQMDGVQKQLNEILRHLAPS